MHRLLVHSYTLTLAGRSYLAHDTQNNPVDPLP
jgi:hypothetical protein